MRVLGIVLRAQSGQKELWARETVRDNATWGIFFGSVSPGGYTLCYETKQVIERLQKKKGITACMRAHEDRVRDDGLRLSRGRGWVVVVGIVPLSRE